MRRFFEKIKKCFMDCFFKARQVDSLGSLLMLSEQIRQRDEDLTNLLDIQSDGWWAWDIESGHDYLSKTWCRLLGYRQDELKPHVDTWTSLMHPDDRPKAEKAMSRHIESKGTEAYRLVARYKHKDGHWVTLRDRGQIVKWSDDGRPLRMVGYEKVIKA